MRSIFISIMTFLMMTACTTAPEVNIGIVPAPVSVSVKEHGRFALGDNITVKAASEDLLAPAAVFAEQAGRILGYVPEIASGKTGRNAICVSVDPSLEKEEYRLKVTRSGITVRGGSGQGVFHGLQSLRQVLVECKDAGALPLMTVEDRPFFGYRGMMLDVCRHFSTVDEVKEFIDILSMHKVNTFHWHLTDDQGWRIQIEKYPLLTEKGAERKETVIGHASKSREYDGKPYGKGMYYTHDQIRDVVRYAADRYIEVIPEIEMPGHTLAALASYPELGCKGKGYAVATTWGIFDDVACPGKDDVLRFFEGVLDEVIELFPSHYIHIGGDECPKTRWETCPYCQERIRKEGLKDEKELQSWFMKKMEQYINSKGKAVIGWEEILEGGVSPTATVMCWKHPEIGIEAARLGNKVIMVNSQYSYFDYYQAEDTSKEPFAIGGYVPVSKVYSYDPYDSLTGDDRKPVIGVQANLWREYIKDMSHVEYMVLPRIAAMSENGWSYDRKDYEDFVLRMDGLRMLYDINGYNYAKHIFN